MGDGVADRHLLDSPAHAEIHAGEVVAHLVWLVSADVLLVSHAREDARPPALERGVVENRARIAVRDGRDGPSRSKVDEG
jgi:hypothetical protein